jgi:DNA-directed RNA polymerase subunit omega
MPYVPNVHNEVLNPRHAGGVLVLCWITLNHSAQEPQPMIEAFKSDEILDKLGGRFKVTALVQKRWAELMQGARPLVDRNGRSDLEVAVDEIVQGKITIDFDEHDLTKPDVALGLEAE